MNTPEHETEYPNIGSAAQTNTPAFQTAGIVLDAEQRKKRITFWTIAIILACVVFTVIGTMSEFVVLGIMFSDEFCIHNAYKAAGVVALITLFFMFPFLIASIVFWFYYILRLWQEIPREFAQTTPLMAAWLSLIPIFHLYWIFICVAGLYQDMNKAMESYGQKKRFNAMLILVACIIWVAIFLFAMMLGTASAIVSWAVAPVPIYAFISLLYLALSFASCLFSVVIYWIIRKDVVEFIDIKESAGR